MGRSRKNARLYFVWLQDLSALEVAMTQSVFQKRYQEKAVPLLKEKFSFKNIHEVPRIERAVINVGVGRLVTQRRGAPVGKKVIKGEEDMVRDITEAVAAISGQKAQIVRSKKSIASFKLRQGMINGVKVTLRGKRMKDFFIRFIDVSLARTRDFRGIARSAVDSRGNLTVGVKESVIFPELAEANTMFGMEVTFVTSAHSRETGLALFEAMGVPFGKDSELVKVPKIALKVRELS